MSDRLACYSWPVDTCYDNYKCKYSRHVHLKLYSSWKYKESMFACVELFKISLNHINFFLVYNRGSRPINRWGSRKHGCCLRRQRGANLPRQQHWWTVGRVDFFTERHCTSSSNLCIRLRWRRNKTARLWGSPTAWQGRGYYRPHYPGLSNRHGWHIPVQNNTTRHQRICTFCSSQ